MAFSKHRGGKDPILASLRKQRGRMIERSDSLMHANAGRPPVTVKEYQPTKEEVVASVQRMAARHPTTTTRDATTVKKPKTKRGM